MSENLIIILTISIIILFISITYILKKGRIEEKYALLWYFIDLILLLVVIFHKPISEFANMLGFYPLSTFVISIFIGLLLLLVVALTVMMAGQKKKTILLIQEISILKNEVAKLKDERK